MLRATGPRERDPSVASEQILRSAPVGEPLVLAGLWALARLRGDDATVSAARALTAFEAWGVAWDKRLRVERWRQLAEFIMREGQTRSRELAAAARRARGVLEGMRGSPARLWAQLDVLGVLPPERQSPPLSSPQGSDALLPARFAQYISGLRSASGRPMSRYPGLRAQPWYDPSCFSVVKELERLAPAIAKEAKLFDPNRFQEEAESIRRDGRWSVLFLIEMGRRNDAVLARCPTLEGIIKRHRTLTTRAGLMYFSCLDPHTRVAPHRGPTNVRLRCHLGLDIPPDCGIRVGGVAGTWQAGRCLVFDDSFTHEVWNDSDRRRLVLILDLWHPDLSEDEADLLAGLDRYATTSEEAAQQYRARNEASLYRATARIIE
jgi:aspartate beta-hydroxylase